MTCQFQISVHLVLYCIASGHYGVEIWDDRSMYAAGTMNMMIMKNTMKGFRLTTGVDHVSRFKICHKNWMPIVELIDPSVVDSCIKTVFRTISGVFIAGRGEGEPA